MSLTIRRMVFDQNVLAFYKSCFLQALSECGYEARWIGASRAAQEPDDRHCRLLRTRRQRPRCRTAE